MVLCLFAWLWQTFLARLVASQGCQSGHTGTYAMLFACFEKLVEANLICLCEHVLASSPLSGLMSMNNENDQANRAISTGKLHTLLRFHTRPINVVVFHGSQGNTRFQVGFPLRCLQRLSIPYIATLLCPWQDNRSTRDMSIPVLSY